MKIRDIIFTILEIDKFKAGYAVGLEDAEKVFKKEIKRLRREMK